MTAARPAPVPAPVRPALPPVLPPPAAVGDRVGPWLLDEVLGPGVFTATEVATGDAVVVKVAEPTPAATTRARGEVAALEALGGGDPALVVVAGVHEEGGRLAVATRRVPGVALDRAVADRGPLPFPIAARLLAPIAEALAGIHDRGWVHGDVSPANVVVDGLAATLVDLGSARPIDGAGPVHATPATAAPEVVAGAPPSPAGDVWSLAATAVVAVTGEPPTTGSPLAASMAFVLRRALADDPAARPSAAALAATLRAVAAPPRSTPLAAGPTPAVVPRAERTTVDLGTRPPPVAPASRTPPAWPLVLAAAGAAATAVLLEGLAR